MESTLTCYIFIIIGITVRSFPISMNDECFGMQNGHYSDGYGCNNTYTLCLGGVATVKQCEKGLYFNLDEGKCDVCHKNRFCKHPMKEYGKMISAKCTGKSGYCSASGTCIPDYICCDEEGVAHEKRCPVDYEFDQIMKICFPSRCSEHEQVIQVGTAGKIRPWFASPYSIFRHRKS